MLAKSDKEFGYHDLAQLVPAPGTVETWVSDAAHDNRPVASNAGIVNRYRPAEGTWPTGTNTGRQLDEQPATAVRSSRGWAAETLTELGAQRSLDDAVTTRDCLP